MFVSDGAENDDVHSLAFFIEEDHVRLVGMYTPDGRERIVPKNLTPLVPDNGRNTALCRWMCAETAFAGHADSKCISVSGARRQALQLTSGTYTPITLRR